MAHKHNSKTADTEPKWSEVDKTALPRIAFADQGEPDKKSTWKYPHHWVKGGTKKNEDGIWVDGELYLHRGGLDAAWAAANGARSGKKASDKVIAHLEAHRSALGIGSVHNAVRKGSVTLLDRMHGTPWAILPEKLSEISAFIEARINGANVDGELSSARESGKSGIKASQDYHVTESGVAVIPLYGVLMKRANLITNSSGGTSTMVFASKLAEADADSTVKAIVIDVDSPGGTVDGTHTAMEAVRSVSKPVVAFTDGLMASAAYYIASAADAIVAGRAAEIGSIGVIAMHYDMTGADARAGVKRTPIYAGKYKAVGSDALPLDEESYGVIKAMVDAHYELFVESVAQNRGLSEVHVVEVMGDGRVWLGDEAQRRGFIDRIGTFDDAVDLALDTATKKGAKQMELTKDILKAEYPELYGEVYEEGRASVDVASIEAEAEERGHTKGFQEGVEAERERVVSLIDADADRDATIQAIRDGVSVEAAFKMFYEAEKQKRVVALSEMEEEAPAPVPGATGDNIVQDSFEAKLAQLMREGMGRAEAFKKAKEQWPDLFEEYIERVNTKKD